MAMRNETVSIKHDGFARFSVIRRKVNIYKRTCAWCDQTRKDGSLFEYGTEGDSIGSHKNWDGKYFCCKTCRDAFYA